MKKQILFLYLIMGHELLLIDFEERYSYLLETPFDPDLNEQQLSFGEDQIVTIWHEPGSDGMSDRTYPYSVCWEDPNYPQLGAGHAGRSVRRAGA